MSQNAFYYEDGQENIYNENGEKNCRPTRKCTNRNHLPKYSSCYYNESSCLLGCQNKDKEDTEMQDILINKIKLANSTVNSTYRFYDDYTREKFIDRMIEGPVKRGRVAAIARNLGVKSSTAARWWTQYQETEEAPYKKSEKNLGRSSNFTGEHEQHAQEIVEKDPQLCAVDIFDSLTSKLEGFSISKSQMNYHLKNNMFVSVKKPTFEPKIRNFR